MPPRFPAAVTAVTSEPQKVNPAGRTASGGDQTSPIEPRRIPLTQLKKGDRAVVDLQDLPPEDTRLLEAMGLNHQCEVRVCRAGTPCIVQIEATRLGISADVAARILATPCSCYPDVGHRSGDAAGRPAPASPPDSREGGCCTNGRDG